MLEIDITLPRADFTLNATFLAPAGVTAVFGRSGSGKTSLLRSVAGLEPRAQGRIAVGGTVFQDRGMHLSTAQRKIGYVFQDARLFPHLTVAQNLHYGGSHDADHVIDLLGLDGVLGRRPAGLSGGEAQRVAIGRALMSDPRLLILDEPLSSLDAARKAEVLPYLERLRDAAQVPMLFVSHDISEVARLATTLVVLEAGRAVVSGPLEDVLSDPAAMPLIGVRDAGAVVMARVMRHDMADGLTLLQGLGTELAVPGLIGAVGQSIRLRIPAQDIILSGMAPKDISALNVVPVTVTGIQRGHGPGVAVGLAAGDGRLLARVTRRSAQQMALAKGDKIYAILKATAIAPANIEGRGGG